jgi:hypothetical protein
LRCRMQPHNMPSHRTGPRDCHHHRVDAVDSTKRILAWIYHLAQIHPTMTQLHLPNIIGSATNHSHAHQSSGSANLFIVAQDHDMLGHRRSFWIGSLAPKSWWSSEAFGLYDIVTWMAFHRARGLGGSCDLSGWYTAIEGWWLRYMTRVPVHRHEQWGIAAAFTSRQFPSKLSTPAMKKHPLSAWKLSTP